MAAVQGWGVPSALLASTRAALRRGSGRASPAGQAASFFQRRQQNDVAGPLRSPGLAAAGAMGWRGVCSAGAEGLSTSRWGGGKQERPLPGLPGGGAGSARAAAAAAERAGEAAPAADEGGAAGGDVAGGRGGGGGGGGRRLKQTGALAAVPHVQPPEELLGSGLKKARNIGASKTIKNAAQRTKKRAAKQLDALTQELAVPLGVYVKGFPPPRRLHPFEQALLELTLGEGEYERVLGSVDKLRKRLLQEGKNYAGMANKTGSKQEALDLLDAGFAAMESIYRGGCWHITELKEMAKTLRALPVVEPNTPTVVLVGAPNVGKSSLVRALSSGAPEVCNYPFTTRSIKMGHFFIEGLRHQVTDTPGLLAREDDDRNLMEKLTLASIEHLPTAVLFVTDLTEECGTSIEDQLAIREELLSRYPGRPWMDVLSKGDLLPSLLAGEEGAGGAGDAETAAEHAERARAGVAAVPSALRVSSLTGDGVDGMEGAVLKMMADRRAALEGAGVRVGVGSDTGVGEGWVPPEDDAGEEGGGVDWAQEGRSPLEA